jgi:hypothetical protein
MPNFHHFLILADMPAQDDPDRAKSMLHFPVPISEGRKFIVSLLGEPHAVYCICVTIPNSDAHISDADADRISKINSHMLSTLRGTYNSEADVLRNGDGFLNISRVDEQDYPKSLGFLYGPPSPNTEFRVDVKNIEDTFKNSAQIKEIIALIGEAGVSTLPLQYKFLHLYKVLDLVSNGKKGFSSVVREIIDKRDSQFQSLGLNSQKFRNFIHTYRDKCAHIYTSNAGALGIVGLLSADVEAVRKVLPLLRQTIIEAVHTRYPDTGLTFRAPSESIPPG